ncbi:protease complex subunit PrcB family protein [Tenacibaculum ovolyticum]|uniref:protease complex subunit PrcB family protein n=1 Tax=Tenacibaculum ovolyticum TaxID=104270 RepID=UPI0022F391B4|nr:protease complex subunit PrcB family protein [Tenacibaculum ovolyticum]WBX75204.1 protease complex subunit PrcB family protein [Tenacibaculum ovolyticum]
MKLVVTILFSIMLTSCPNKDQRGLQEESLFVSLFKGRMNGSENIKETNKVITSDNEWQYFLSTLNIDKNNIPVVDFSKSTLIVLIDKVRNTGGFDIGVEKISIQERKLIINVKHAGPKPTDMVTMAIEQPFQVIKINKTNKEIIFVTK